jgi:hypothetical protein
MSESHLIHIGDPDKHLERERWTVVLGPNRRPESLRQDFVVENALASGASIARPGRVVQGYEILSADLPDIVRRKLSSFLGEQNA